MMIINNTRWVFKKPEMDWVKIIRELLIETIDIYMKYYVQGELQEILPVLCIEEQMVEIKLLVNGTVQTINYDLYRVASEENERDRQCECYLSFEVLWMEFFTACDFDENMIKKYISEIIHGLSQHYGIEVQVTYLESRI